MGNSTGQSPSGIRGTGPLVGPPALNRSLGGCGVGDAEALLGGDALLLRALLLRSAVLVDGLLAGSGVGMVLSGGMLTDALLEADALLLADTLPPPTSTGVSSLAGSSYGYTSQATPEVPSEAVPIGPSNPLGSRLSSACASACELKLTQSNSSYASAGLLGLSICW
jgi:hypothetical protein